MAELKFSKLKLKVDKSVETVEIEASDGTKHTLEVKQYLPFIDKTNMVTRVVENSIVKGIVRKDFLEANLSLALIYNYTNLGFTDKMLENNLDTFDILESNGIIDIVIDLIDDVELENIDTYINSYVEQMENAYVSSVSGYAAQSQAVENMVKTMFGDELANEFDLNKKKADVEPSE